MPAQVFFCFGALCALSFSLSCGVQGPPRPPRVEQPEQITNLAVAQEGATFELTFTLPLLAADGERLTKPLELEIFRTVTKHGEKTPATVPDAVAWRTLSAKELLQYSVGEKIVFPYRFTPAEFVQFKGATFTFALRGLTHGFRNRPAQGELSNVAQTTLLDVSVPVDNLQIRPTERALQLSWTAPNRSLSGQTISIPFGYRIYKSTTGKPATFELCGETASSQFSNSEFKFGEKYFYKVRAVFKQGELVAESDDSAVVETTPRDTFPPSPPTNLNGLFSSGATQLVWTSNTEPDLAGYNVYRREKNTTAQKINTELLRTPTLEDRSVQSGRQYVYRVTAVDSAHNESEPSPEITIETQ